MVSVEYHSGINIALNCCLMILIWLSLPSTIFSFNNYHVGLSQITHKIQYEDFPAEVDISFGQFEKYACLRSSNPEILTLCGNILSLESSGFIYKVGCIISMFSILTSILNLTVILLQKQTYLTTFVISHYSTSAMYWIFVCAYFIFSGSNSMTSPSDQAVIVTFEKGAFIMFLAGGLSLFILAHYLFMRKFLDFDSLIDKCDQMLPFSVFSEKKVEDPGEVDRLKRNNLELDHELKLKEREIGELSQKINDLAAKLQDNHDDSNESQSSHHIGGKKKKLLRANRGEKKFDTIESVKQELGELRATYAQEKHEWDEERRKLLDKPDADYFYALINDLCAKIEDLQRQLFERESSEDEKRSLYENLNEIKSQIENFKKEAVDEEKNAWENERNLLNQIINDLQMELEHARALALQHSEADRAENQRLAEELIKSEGSIKNLMDRINDMGSEVSRLERELFASQEHKHNLELASSDIIHLKKTLASKQEDHERTLKTLKNLKEAVGDKETHIEALEKTSKKAEETIEELSIQVEDLKKSVNDKDFTIKQEREESRKKIEGKDEELALLSNQALNLERELEQVKKWSTAERSQEHEDLKQEIEALEKKVISMNSIIKKTRENCSVLETQLQNSELANEELAQKLSTAQDFIVGQRAAVGELKNKVEAFEDLTREHQAALKAIDALNREVESLKTEIQGLKDYIRALESVKKDKEFYEKQCKSTLEDLEHSQKSRRDLELELIMLSNLKSENANLTDQTTKLTEALEASKQQLSEIRSKYSQQDIDFDKERDELLYTLSKSKKEVAQLERKVKIQEDYLNNELEASLRDQEHIKDELKTLTAQNEIYKQETIRLNHLQLALKQQLHSKDQEIAELSQGKDLLIEHEQTKKIYENQIEEIQKSLKDTESRLGEIIKEKDLLREELATKQTELQAVSEEYANMQNQIFEERKRSASPEYGEHLNFSPLSEHSLSSARSAQDMIIIESISPSYNNPLLENVSKLRKQPPMTYKNVWKLFEAMMLDKCKMDRLEFAMGRQPRTMTEYMLDFVYLHYGLKALALKQLKALIASLEQLYKQGHPYGILFCRFLGLFHPRPLSYQISIYLLMIQEQFVALTYKVKEKPSNFTQSYEIAQFGGQASVIDIMELIQKICRNHREIGERIITTMHKDRVDKVELSILKICGCMARMGKTSDFIFEILNAERRGRGLDYQEFIDGIRYTLNIWVTQEEAEDLCRYIDLDDTGLITFDNWYQKVNFVEFAEKMYAKVALITKSDFLGALVDEYEREIVDDYRVLKGVIRYPTLNQATFEGVLLQLDPNLEDDDIFRLYQEARAQDEERSGGISAHAVCVTVLKHNIGGYGIGMFDVYALDSSLPKTPTQGVRTELVVERDGSGRLEIDLRRRNK